MNVVQPDEGSNSISSMYEDVHILLAVGTEEYGYLEVEV